MISPLLADGISLPIALGFGVGFLALVNLGVAAIEAPLLARGMKVSFASAFGPAFRANVVSALASLPLFFMQDSIVYGSEITRTIPGFVHGYPLVAALLTVVYFTLSVAVEALVLRRRAPLRAVLLANVASYAVLGPVFFLLTRPTFAGFDLRPDAAWSANAGEVFYAIDPGTHALERGRIGEAARELIVPTGVASFLLAGPDARAVAYRGVDGSLYVRRRGEGGAILAWTTTERFLMTGVSLSPDGRTLAHLEEAKAERVGVRRVNLEAGTTTALAEIPARWPRDAAVLWGADGSRLFADGYNGWKATSDGLRWEPVDPSATAVVEEYLGVSWAEGADWSDLQDEDASRGARADVWPGLGSRLTIKGAGPEPIELWNDYGFPKFGFPRFNAPTFLPRGGELLVEWYGGLYVVDPAARRLGYVGRGEKYLLPTERFRRRLVDRYGR